MFTFTVCFLLTVVVKVCVLAIFPCHCQHWITAGTVEHFSIYSSWSKSRTNRRRKKPIWFGICQVHYQNHRIAVLSSVDHSHSMLDAARILRSSLELWHFLVHHFKAYFCMSLAFLGFKDRLILLHRLFGLSKVHLFCIGNESTWLAFLSSLYIALNIINSLMFTIYKFSVSYKKSVNII